MVAHIKTIAFQGVDAVPIDVQVHLAPGQNAFTVVGLPDKSVAESRERVRAALSAIGLALPYDRITINLSPADLPKEGSHYDVPIALGLLVAMGAVEQAALAIITSWASWGLMGRVLVCRAPCRRRWPLWRRCRAYLSGGMWPEAAWSGLGAPDKPGIIAAAHMLEIINHVRGTQMLMPPQVQRGKPRR